MRISIITASALFVRDAVGATAELLAEQLRGRGHAVERIAIPFEAKALGAIPEQMLACKLLELSTGEPDLVIALQFPAYLSRCPKLRVWLLEHFATAYEPIEGGRDRETRIIHGMIRAADAASLNAAEKIFAGSEPIAGRLRTLQGLGFIDVLEAPSGNDPSDWDAILRRLLD